jgi:hypothetical protein
MGLFWNKKNTDNATQSFYKREAVPLFTTRRSGDSTISVSSTDTWEGKMYGLDSAAAAIGIDEEFQPSREDVYSIPDVFSEIRAINTALSDDSNVLHESAVADWRASLTMILLYHELQIDIEETVIDFNALSDNDAMFLHTAAEYLPKAYGGKIIIYTTRSVDGRRMPFALSSPEYFICPAKEIRAQILVDSGIAEFDGIKTIFKEPSDFLHRNPALGYRITEILSEAHTKNMVGSARTLISSFIQMIDVKRYAEARLASSRILIRKWEELNSANPVGGGLTIADIFTEKIALFQTADEYGNKNSHTALQYEDVFQGALADHRVWAGGKAIYYALLPLCKDFLAKSAYSQDGQPNSILFKTLKMEQQQVGKSKYINVSLLYNSVIYTIRYAEDNWIMPSPGKYSLPPVSVWPNSREETHIWNIYYTFAGLRYDEDVNAHNWTGLSFEALMPDGSIVPGEVFTEARNVAREDREDIDCSYEIITTREYPHILCVNSVAGSDKYYGSLAFRSGGDKPLHIVQDRTAVVGIDFGTSNTVAFYSSKEDDRNGAPIPIDFKNSNVKPILVNHVFDEMSSRFFLSRKELSGDVSFPTILHFSDKKQETPDLFYGANIYFRGNERTDSTDVAIMKMPNLDADIKWTTDALKKKGTLKFLTQLAVFCAWQTVSKTQAGKLEWRFSFPSSINSPSEFTGALISTAENAAKFVFGNDTPGNQKIDLTSESHAAGLYFLNLKNPIVDQNKGFISIDIGGGSTDISIWQISKSKAKAEASVKFAGRDILTNNAIALCEKEEMVYFWRQIGISEKIIKDIVNLWESSDLDLPLRFDTAFAHAGNNLNYSLMINKDQAPLSYIIKLIAFDLSMLSALAASILRDLVFGDMFELSNELVVMFCGNGSRIRDWLPVDHETMLKNIFTKIVGEDLQDTRIRFEKSNNPKQVVAAGLVSVNSLRSDTETFNPADYKYDVLDSKVLVDGDNKKFPHVLEEVLYLFGSLYDILISDETNFQLEKYPSFRDKEIYIEKLRAGISSLDPVSTGLRKITYANAFVKCAEVSNYLLVTDMRNNM